MGSSDSGLGKLEEALLKKLRMLGRTLHSWTPFHLSPCLLEYLGGMMQRMHLGHHLEVKFHLQYLK